MIDTRSDLQRAFDEGYEKGKADGAMIYGNEHNCIMTIFGECSYAETGCGDCAVVEKVRKALSADRPQGEWVLQDNKHHIEKTYLCSNCENFQAWGESEKYNFCPNCGAEMKGADDE